MNARASQCCDDVGDLRAEQAEVDRHGDQAGPRQRDVDLHPLDAVVGQHGDTIALAQGRSARPLASRLARSCHWRKLIARRESRAPILSGCSRACVATASATVRRCRMSVPSIIVWGVPPADGTSARPLRHLTFLDPWAIVGQQRSRRVGRADGIRHVLRVPGQARAGRGPGLLRGLRARRRCRSPRPGRRLALRVARRTGPLGAGLADGHRERHRRPHPNA